MGKYQAGQQVVVNGQLVTLTYYPDDDNGIFTYTFVDTARGDAETRSTTHTSQTQISLPGEVAAELLAPEMAPGTPPADPVTAATLNESIADVAGILTAGTADATVTPPAVTAETTTK